MNYYNMLLYFIISLLISGCDLSKINQPNFEGDIRKDGAQELLSSEKKNILNLINKARSQTQDCGEYGVFPPAKPLKWNNNLYSTALEHSADMASVSSLSHIGSGTETDLTAIAFELDKGSSVIQRMEYNNYTSSHSGPFGENVLYGTYEISGKEAINLWLESPGHCANIMNPSFSEVGVALARNGKGWNYWSMELGN